jgi:CheY-like chemotaxis protein
MSLRNEMYHFKKVLIIDDNEIDRYMAGRCIEKYGFAEEVVLKESASRALVYLMSLEKHVEELPELIFLATFETDGFRFMEHYQKLPEVIKSNCTIVMLTSSANHNGHVGGKDTKYVSLFLNKPLDKEKLQTLALEIPIRTSRKQSHAA